MAGLLLTGGSSRRLGVEKATFVVRGERLADRAARVLATACAPVVEVGPGVTGLPTAREDPPGEGPLAGLAAGVAALATRGPVVLLACDLPFVESPLLAWLASWEGDGTVVPVADGRAQTTCGRYGVDALERAPELLAAGQRSLRALVDAVDATLVGDDEWRAVASAGAFADVDTLDDIARLGLGSRRGEG